MPTKVAFRVLLRPLERMKGRGHVRCLFVLTRFSFIAPSVSPVSWIMEPSYSSFGARRSDIPDFSRSV